MKENFISQISDLFGMPHEDKSNSLSHHNSNQSEEFNKDLEQLQSIVSRAAIGAAKSHVKIKSTIEKIKKVSLDIEKTTELTKVTKDKLDDITRSSIFAAESSKKTDGFCTDGKTISHATLQTAEELRSHMNKTFERIDSLVKNIKGVADISKTIQNVAFQTKLLAFNASVEAARAGEHGRGFSIVAHEIQKLGDHTSNETKTIMNLLNKINSDLDPSREALTQSKLLAETTAAKSIEVNSYFQQISTLVNDTTGQLQSIAESCSEQKKSMDATYDRMIETQQNSKDVEKNTEELNLHTQNLANIAEDAFYIFGKYDVGTFFNQTIQRANDLVIKHEQLLSNLLSENQCDLKDILEHNYIEINSSNINLISHLFDIKNVPHNGFVPSKFVKKYEPLIDLSLQKITDDILALDKRYKFVLFVDINCHATTHNKVFTAAWTGEHGKDFLSNRIKRFFDDNDVLLRASRVGLKNADAIPKKASRKEFLQHCGNLEINKNNQNSYLVQTYTRDTGEVMSVLSMPTYVLGQRVGAIIFGWVDE